MKNSISGTWEQIITVPIQSSNQVDEVSFTSKLSDTYQSYKVKISQLEVSGSNTCVYFTAGTGGANSDYIYDYVTTYCDTNGPGEYDADGGQDYGQKSDSINITGGYVTNTTTGPHEIIIEFSCNDSGISLNYAGTFLDINGSSYTVQGSGIYDKAGADSIQFSAKDGYELSGNFQLLGLLA